MTTLPHTDSVECELHQGWLTIWFSQPERRNPLTDEVVADLQRICDALQGASFESLLWTWVIGWCHQLLQKR